MRPGERAEISGPLGNSWAESGAEIPEGDMALVAGGIGIAPLALYAQELGSREFDFYAGFRSGSFGLEGIKPRSLITASEDGSGGLKGRILDFFSPIGYSLVCACGPEAMLKAVASICEDDGIPCLFSLERRMACGVGACLGCTVETRKGNRRCCGDGPVFNAPEVQFDE
jgi:NAD(P)H-flavin reductase